MNELFTVKSNLAVHLSVKDGNKVIMVWKGVRKGTTCVIGLSYYFLIGISRETGQTN